MPYPPIPALRIPTPWRVAAFDGTPLLLRLPAQSDVEAVTAACQDPLIQRFTLVPSPYTAADAESYVSAAQALADAGQGLVLLVVDAADEQVLASVGLELDWREATAELGYWAAPAGRGRGVVTAAAGAVCRFAVDELGLARVWLRAAANNAGSTAVARRLGFTHEGVLRGAGIDGPTGDLGAPRVDMHLWGLLADELPEHVGRSSVTTAAARRPRGGRGPGG